MAKNQLRPALSAFLLMLTMSLLSTALSFFVAPVCEALDFGRGSFTLYYSLMVASGAVSASFLGTYMNKHGVRGVVLVSGIWCGLGFMGLSFSSALWMFYLLGAAMGLFGSTCVYLAANVIVQQSYSSKHASAVLGFVMAGAFGNVKGGTMGGTSRKEALKSLRFYLAVALMCILAVCSCISQHLPSVLGEMGHDSVQIGVMVSVMTAASAVGTVAEGVICSRLGIQKTMLGVLVVYAVGYVLMSLRMGIYVALVFLAFGSGSIGTLMPVVVRRIFGGRDYAAIWSVVISCSSVASFLAAPLWGMVYDFCGSYAPALMAMPVFLTAGIFCLLGAFRNIEF